MRYYLLHRRHAISLEMDIARVYKQQTSLIGSPIEVEKCYSILYSARVLLEMDEASRVSLCSLTPFSGGREERCPSINIQVTQTPPHPIDVTIPIFQWAFLVAQFLPSVDDRRLYRQSGLLCRRELVLSRFYMLMSCCIRVARHL